MSVLVLIQNIITFCSEHYLLAVFTSVISYLYFGNYSNVVQQFELSDLSNLDPLPQPFFHRDIDFMFENPTKPIFIFGPKHTGKSTLGRSIAHKCVQQEIPFIYFIATAHATPCFAFARRLGYYKDNWLSKMFPAPACHLKGNEEQDGVFDSIRKAAKGVNGKPFLIVDDIEKFKTDDGTELQSLCEFARYSFHEIQFVFISTGDTRFKLPMLCRDFRDIFSSYFIGDVTEKESIDYLVNECGRTVLDSCLIYQTFGGKLHHLHELCVTKEPFQKLRYHLDANIRGEMQYFLKGSFETVGKKILNGQNKMSDFNEEELELLLNDADRFFTTNDESIWIFTEKMVEIIFKDTYNIHQDNATAYCHSYNNKNIK